MQAVLSGRAGIGLLFDGKEWFSIRHDKGQPERAIPAIRSHLLNCCRDVVVLEDTDVAVATETLALEHAVADSLDLLLFVLDPELPANVRLDAAQELNGKIERTRERIEGIIFAKPAPLGFDFNGALIFTQRSGQRCIDDLVKSIADHQPIISRVHETWLNIDEHLFSDESSREHARQLFVHCNVFAKLVTCISKRADTNTFLIDVLSIPQVRQFPNHRGILTALTGPFKTQATSELVVKIDVATEEVPDSEDRERGRVRRPFIAGIIDRIEAQKSAIIDVLRDGQIDKAKSFVEDLIAFQLRHGEPEFACKSLCDLALKSQTIFHFEFQFWLTSRAIEIGPDDGWCWAQHGKALLNLNRPQEALKAYEEALPWKPDAATRNGRAEVLKALNRLPEALEAYEQTVRDYPDNPIAKSGRAEVLKALNRLPEALQAYDEAIELHPESSYLRNGRAEVLKALNRLPDALAAYEEISEFERDVVARSGRAGVLKALNRLPEALNACEQTIRLFPDDSFARNGRAEVLKALNRLPEALAVYDETIQLNPNLAVARCGRAEVLKALNKLPEALNAYDETIALFPHETTARKGRAGVLKSLNRLSDALAAYEDVLQRVPDSFALNGRASVLVLLSRFDEALRSLPVSNPVTPGDWVSAHIRGIIYLKQGKPDQAIQVFESGIKDNPRPADRDLFRTALSVALLRKKQLYRIPELLVEVSKQDLLTSTMLLQAHVWGMLGDKEKLYQLRLVFPSKVAPILEPLREEIDRRFLKGNSPRHDDNWLFEREVDLLVA